MGQQIKKEIFGLIVSKIRLWCKSDFDSSIFITVSSFYLSGANKTLIKILGFLTYENGFSLLLVFEKESMEQWGTETAFAICVRPAKA